MKHKKYKYRGLPCVMGTQRATHAITGHDTQGGSGVLEWCYSREDAAAMLEDMRNYQQFRNLQAEEWSPR